MKIDDDEFRYISAVVCAAVCTCAQTYLPFYRPQYIRSMCPSCVQETIINDTPIYVFTCRFEKKKAAPAGAATLLEVQLRLQFAIEQAGDREVVIVSVKEVEKQIHISAVYADSPEVEEYLQHTLPYRRRK